MLIIYFLCKGANLEGFNVQSVLVNWDVWMLSSPFHIFIQVSYGQYEHSTLVSWWSNGWSLYVLRHCHLCVTFYDLYAVIAIVLCCLLRMPASTLHTKSTLFNFYLTKAIPTIFCSPGIPLILASRLKPYFCLEFASSENWWRWSHLKRMVPQSKELWIFFLWLT